jgi:hypothetical protein
MEVTTRQSDFSTFPSDYEMESFYGVFRTQPDINEKSTKTK